MVLPIILGVGGAVLAIGWLIRWYRQPPKDENNTVREIAKRIKQQEEELNAVQRVISRRALAAERVKRRKAVDEEEEKQREERKRESIRKGEKEAERVMAERERQVKENMRKLQVAEAELEEKEKELAEEARIARADAEEERAGRIRLENGLQPIKWPTRDEFQRGRELIQYDEENLHFAIVGESGSGKSSLINAFLNCDIGQLGAAATGVTETTATISRYPDPGEQPPRPWTVWYDVPGAGTQNVSAWQYFINQGLFVFDIILITIGDRFKETDIQLLRDCQRFKIPALIVRSKADMHIDNLLKANGKWGGNDWRVYQEYRDMFITQSKQMVRGELAKAGLADQEVYVVSSYTLRHVYNRSLEGSEEDLPLTIIDEKTLIRTIMLLAIQRRHGDNLAFQTALELAIRGSAAIATTEQAGQALGRIIQVVSNRARTAFRHQDRSFDEENIISAEPSPHYQQLQPELPTNNARPRPQTPNNPNKKPYVLWTKRVIRLPWATEPDHLKYELAACNPDYATMAAAPPRMLSPVTAVLNFLPDQTIPDSVMAFGDVLQLKPYTPGGKQNTNRYAGPSGGTRSNRQPGQTSNRGMPGRGGSRYHD